MVSQELSYGRFRALHERPGAFVMPNAWDGASALLLHRAGFAALGPPRSPLRHLSAVMTDAERSAARRPSQTLSFWFAYQRWRALAYGASALEAPCTAARWRAWSKRLPRCNLGDIPSAIRGAVPASEIDDLIPKGVAEAN